MSNSVCKTNFLWLAEFGAAVSEADKADSETDEEMTPLSLLDATVKPHCFIIFGTTNSGFWYQFYLSWYLLGHFWYHKFRILVPTLPQLVPFRTFLVPQFRILVPTLPQLVPFRIRTGTDFSSIIHFTFRFHDWLFSGNFTLL